MLNRLTFGGTSSASSPQRPICSRWIPYIPAAVPAKCSSKNNSLHLWPSFWSIFLFSSVMCHRHTPSSKRNLSSKIFAESATIYFFPLTKWFRLLFSAGPMLPSLHMPAGDYRSQQGRHFSGRETVSGPILPPVGQTRCVVLVGRGRIGLLSNNAPVRPAVDEHWRV